METLFYIAMFLAMVDIILCVYLILGLKPGANLDDLKSSYRLLAKKYHPDKNTNELESEKQARTLQFMSVQEAYVVLSQILR